MKKEWTVLNPNPQGELVGSILKARGIKDPVHFLQPNKEDMLPYEGLSNINLAAQIVLKAIEEGKNIHILADVDLDGCASNAILYRYLICYTNRVSWSINTGKKHGLNMEEIPSYIGKYDLVIAVDSSSESYEEQQYLKDNGIEVIILDHHKIDNIDRCSAIVVNSQLNNYKNPALAGAGVVFRFINYLDFLQGTKGAENFYDLAASGIIGDMQDISEDSPENRYICLAGFNYLRNPGLKELVGNYEFNATSVIYSIAPTINAGVRTKHNELAAQLLLEDDRKKIREIISELKDLKVIQNIQKDKLVEELEIEIKEKGMENLKVMGFIIPQREELAQADITGLVANVISDRYDSLVIIVHNSEEEGVLKGSIRGNGVPSFKDLISNTKLVIMCSGHDGAAGIEVYESNWENLINTLNKELENTELKIVSQADVLLEPSEISMQLIKKVEYVNRISGTGFKPIKVMIEELEAEKICKMKDIHSKFEAEGMEFIKWNSTLSDELQCEDGIYKEVSVVGTPGLSNFRGKAKRQLIIDDVKIEEKLEFFR